MERIPKPGEIYRHFKNKLYQVVAVARHTETGEELVVYQALYGAYEIYARPLAMFSGQVDREKHPDAGQTYRFERVERAALAGAGREDAPALNPLLLSFVETKDFDVKLEILAAMEDDATQKDMDALCESLDLPARTGDVADQVRFVRRYLEMRKKFDSKRFR